MEPIDSVGGQAEAATDVLARLDNPGRGYTACTIYEVDTSQADAPAPPAAPLMCLLIMVPNTSKASPDGRRWPNA